MEKVLTRGYCALYYILNAADNILRHRNYWSKTKRSVNTTAASLSLFRPRDSYHLAIWFFKNVTFYNYAATGAFGKAELKL